MKLIMKVFSFWISLSFGDKWITCQCIHNKLVSLCVLLFLVCIPPTSAAPSPYLMPVNAHPPVQSTIFDNPCGIGYETKTESGNYILQDPIELIKMNLNMTINEFKHLNKTWIPMAYDSTINLTKFEDHDLPSKQYRYYVNYRERHPKIGVRKTIQSALSKLYRGLFQYAEAFDKLSRMIPQMESSSHITNHRNLIISKIKSRLKGLVCEVETSINETNTKVSPKFRQNIMLIGKSWPKYPDLTTVLTTDMSIYVKYIAFLEDWYKILELLKKRDRKKRLLNKDKKLKKNNKRNAKPRQAIRHLNRATRLQ